MSILVTCFWNTSNKSNQWKYHMESFFLKLGANVICICSVFNLLFCKRLHFLSYQSYMEMVIVIITIGYMGAQTEQETQSKFLKIWISSLVSLESYSFSSFWCRSLQLSALGWCSVEKSNSNTGNRKQFCWWHHPNCFSSQLYIYFTWLMAIFLKF